jgi:hypothetical protein
VTGLINQELLLNNEYLTAENRILRAHLPARLRLSDPERSQAPPHRDLPRPSTYARREPEKGEKTGGNGGKPSGHQCRGRPAGNGYRRRTARRRRSSRSGHRAGPLSYRESHQHREAQSRVSPETLEANNAKFDVLPTDL